jgi:hypothetical protein
MSTARRMEREQFDALTRLVSAPGSRRRALAALLGVALLRLAPQPAVAGCRAKAGKAKRRCRRQQRDSAGGGSGQCQELNHLCGLLVPDPCCAGLTCTPTFNPVVLGCQLVCATDEDCQRRYPRHRILCQTDLAVCPLLGKCCVPQP